MKRSRFPSSVLSLVLLTIAAFISATVGFERFILPQAEPLRSENEQIKIYMVKSKEVEMNIEITDKV